MDINLAIAIILSVVLAIIILFMLGYGMYAAVTQIKGAAGITLAIIIGLLIVLLLISAVLAYVTYFRDSERARLIRGPIVDRGYVLIQRALA